MFHQFEGIYVLVLKLSIFSFNTFMLLEEGYFFVVEVFLYGRA